MYSHSEGSNSKKPGMWKDEDGYNLHPFICSHKLDSSRKLIAKAYMIYNKLQKDVICYKLSFF